MASPYLTYLHIDFDLSDCQICDKKCKIEKLIPLLDGINYIIHYNGDEN